MTTSPDRRRRSIGNGNGTNGSKGANGTWGTEKDLAAAGRQWQRRGDSAGHQQQVQYLLSIGKRQRLTTVQLEKKIAEIIGRPVGIYDLSKMAAGIVIEALDQWGSGQRVQGSVAGRYARLTVLQLRRTEGCNDGQTDVTGEGRLLRCRS